MEFKRRFQNYTLGVRQPDRNDDAALWFGNWLFRMGHNVELVVAVALDQEIEASTAVHSSLPHRSRLIVFLGSQRRVMQVL
jgi:hypothetical protein